MPSLRHRIETVCWGKPPSNPAERKLLIKLDCIILSYVCLSYFTNYLDRSNLNNAYVSGMKEDIGFVGNAFTYANSMFTAGYVLGQWPSALILASGRIRPRIWFPFCCLMWGVLTIALAFVKTYHQVWAIRFVQGFFEASTFSGTHYLLGCWYKDEELGKRTAVFTSAAQFGTLFSGVMQGGIISTLAGKSGLTGWQWLFVIDFCITIPVAIYGFICFPDTPATTKAWWLTEEERALCLKRLPHVEHQKMTWSTFKVTLRKAAFGWRFWGFCSLWMVSATSYESFGIFAQFQLWLKSTKAFSTQQVNYIPTSLTAVSIVSTYVLTAWSDSTKNRFAVNPVMAASTITAAIIILVWDVPQAAKMFAYAISGIGYAGQASNFAWANQLCRDDEALRSITLAGMNLFSNLWVLWYQIVAYPVVQAPKFRNGQIACIVTAFAGLAIACGIVYCSRKYPPPLPELEGEGAGERKDDPESGSARASGEPLEDSKDEIHPHAVDIRPVTSLSR